MNHESSINSKPNGKKNSKPRTVPRPVRATYSLTELNAIYDPIMSNRRLTSTKKTTIDLLVDETKQPNYSRYLQSNILS